MSFPVHLGPHQSARPTFLSPSGDSFALQIPFVVWLGRSQAEIAEQNPPSPPPQLSLCGEQAHALCILGNADAIAEIYKYELEIIWLKSPFQPRHQIHKHRI